MTPRTDNRSENGAACGPRSEDHAWTRHYRAGLLIRVECENCGITPMKWLGEQPILDSIATGTEEERP